jgi:hypothetical protein
MTRRQRNIAVEARADLILADEASVEAYAAYFKTQMHHGKARRLLIPATYGSPGPARSLTGLV